MTPTRSKNFIWQPLESRLFRSLWIANMASFVGTWIHEVGAAWLMTGLAPTPLYVASVQAAAMLPLFILVVPAGALADVLDQRKLLIVAQTWMLTVAGALTVLTILNAMTPARLLVLTAFLGVGAALSSPAWQAVLPTLVGTERLPAAAALGSLSINIARAVGPAVGGLLVAAGGPAAAFGVNALSFCGVVWILARWQGPPRASSLPAERFLGAVRAGFRYVRHAPRLLSVMARTVVFTVSGSALWALLPLFARAELGLGAAAYGVLLAVLGVGAVTGAILLPRARRRMSLDTLVLIASLVFAVALGGLAGSPALPWAVVALFLGGLAWLLMLSSFNVAAQTILPSWVRGRALSFYLLAFFGSLALGSLAWGALATRVGLRLSLGLAAVGAAASILPRRRFRIVGGEDLDLSPSRHWPAPRLAAEVEADRGPVLVTTEYTLDPAREPEFQQAMERLRRARKRQGAYFWDLFADAEDPGRYLEVYLEDSWLEHLRHHQRVTEEDRRSEAAVDALVEPGSRVVVRHLLSIGQNRASRSFRKRHRPDGSRGAGTGLPPKNPST